MAPVLQCLIQISRDSGRDAGEQRFPGEHQQECRLAATENGNTYARKFWTTDHGARLAEELYEGTVRLLMEYGASIYERNEHLEKGKTLQPIKNNPSSGCNPNDVPRS